MVRNMLSIGLVLACLAVVGCSAKSKLQPLPGPVAGADYFPLEDGATLEFTGGTAVGSGAIDKEEQQWDVTAVTAPDGGEGFMISRRGRGILNAMEMQYGLRDGGIVTWSGMFGASKTEFSPPLVELPESIEPGAKWSWSGTSKGVEMSVDSVLEGVQEVSSRSGPVKCLRIKRTFTGGAVKMTQWYAAGIGLVKVEMENARGRVELQR